MISNICIYYKMSTLIHLVNIYHPHVCVCVCVCWSLSCILLFVTPWTIQPARLLCPWNFSGKNIGVVCYFLLQGIFPTQGSNLSLLHFPHWQMDSLPPRHLGSPITTHSQHIFFFLVMRILNLPSQQLSKIYYSIDGGHHAIHYIPSQTFDFALFILDFSQRGPDRRSSLGEICKLQSSDSVLGQLTQLLRNPCVCPL